MFTQMKDHLAKQLAEIKANGLYKVERTIITPQSSAIRIAERSGKVLNFCANNYLGLSDNPRLISAAKKAMDSHGFGMSSVRFICGAQDLHRELEKAIARYFHTEDTILYAACFDANGGVFEPLLTDQDAIISDSLNHASIIDGVRLCKAKRYRYANADMAELEKIGLLDKPHTSAGRIPSAQGYRYYVDELLNYNDISMQEIKYIQTQLATKVNQIEDLTKIATSTLSEITHYTSVGIGPRVASQNIEEVKFVLLGSRLLMAIILTESGLIKETIIKFDEDVTQEQVDTITYLFNNKLKGKPLTQIDKPMEEYMHSEMSSVLNVVKPVLEQLNKAINEDTPIYMEGANKSFDLPEFKSLDIAKNFVNILDTDKTKQMIDVLNSDDNQDEINVYIGDENVDEALKDFSIITFKHKEEGKDLGTIAIIGPTRMDYSKVISAMKYISKKLGENSETPKLDNPNSKERKDDDNG